MTQDGLLQGSRIGRRFCLKQPHPFIAAEVLRHVNDGMRHTAGRGKTQPREQRQAEHGIGP